MESTNGHANGVNEGDSSGIEKLASTHVFIVPLVLQASAVSAVRIAKKLSSRGVTVTLVTIKHNADELHRIYSRETLQTLRISIEGIDGYEPPARPIPLLQSAALKSAFEPFREKLIANKKAGLPGPSLLLTELFLPWTEEVANELDIPRYTFLSTGANTTRLIQSYHEKEDELTLVPNGPDWVQRSFEILRQQPGLEYMKKATDIPDITFDNGWFEYFRDIGRTLTSAPGIVWNTFYALEHHAVEAVRNAYPGSNKSKVTALYPIGPISTVEDFTNLTFIKDIEDSHAECLEFLGAQPPKSVVYVCLGSSVRLFGEQIMHLARALEGSQCRFLWVLGKGRGNFETLEEVLPPGYLERVNGRGKIVTGWVGQVEILGNPALGAFLSHCGWQSVLESMTCGVPILGWPQVAEQRLNCRMMQDVWNVCVRVTEKLVWELVEQHEFEEAIKTLMFEKEGTVIAANAAKLKVKAEEAVAAGGPSDVALDQLIESFSKNSRRN